MPGPLARPSVLECGELTALGSGLRFPHSTSLLEGAKQGEHQSPARGMDRAASHPTSVLPLCRETQVLIITWTGGMRTNTHRALVLTPQEDAKGPGLVEQDSQGKAGASAPPSPGRRVTLGLTMDARVLHQERLRR